MVSTFESSSLWEARSISRPTTFPSTSKSINQSVRNLASLGAGCVLKLDIETVRLGIVVQLNC